MCCANLTRAADADASQHATAAGADVPSPLRRPPLHLLRRPMSMQGGSIHPQPCTTDGPAVPLLQQPPTVLQHRRPCCQCIIYPQRKSCSSCRLTGGYESACPVAIPAFARILSCGDSLNLMDLLTCSMGEHLTTMYMHFTDEHTMQRCLCMAFLMHECLCV